MTTFGRHGDRSLASLSEEALAAALADAGAGADDIEVVYFGNAAAGVILEQDMIRGQSALRRTALAGKPIFNVENACASGSSALHLAWMSVASGNAEAALAIGAEKLFHPDKARSFTALARGVDRDDAEALLAINKGSSSVFMDIYAAETRDYMSRSGATAEDFAGVAAKNRNAAVDNPLAQFRDRVTLEQVLSSRSVSPPLTLLMCSGIGDGAAAVVVCSERMANRWRSQAVQIKASVIVSGAPGRGFAAPQRRAAALAYERAALGPGDLHVVEVHDASAPAELFAYEDLGLCAEGEAADLFRRGVTAVGGPVSVNASGGLLGRGHPVGATGAAQIVELVDQLRGRSAARQRRNAKVGLAANAGGSVGDEAAAAAVTILTI